jgi:Flp pilus assembly protein TadG
MSGRRAIKVRRGRPEWLPLRCRRGSPAIEFGLACPFLFAMLMGLADLGQALITVRRLTTTAQEIVEAAATFAAVNGSTGVITSAQATQAMSIAAANQAQWLGSGNVSYGITLSSVAIVASPANCTSGCTYSAQTAWSVGIAGGQPTLRACGTLTSVANTQARSLTTLPAGVISPPSILVADLSTLYTPLFTAIVTGPIQMMRSAYMPPRALGSANYVQLSMNSTVNGYTCSGY